MKYEIRFPIVGNHLRIYGNFLLARLADGLMAIFWQDLIDPDAPLIQVTRRKQGWVSNSPVIIFEVRGNDDFCVSWTKSEKLWVFQPMVDGVRSGEMELLDAQRHMFSVLLSEQEK